MGTWVRLKALSARDWGVLFGASAGLLLARLGLPLVRFAAAEPIPAASSEQALASARSVARLVGAAARRMPFSTTCLHRSLVLWWLLRRRGLAPSIHLGTRPADAGHIAAHAWVECAGEAIGESAETLATYHAFDRTVVPRARFGS